MNRYKDSYPVIGIRPVIDARKGALDVRGSLEDQTMSMAIPEPSAGFQKLLHVLTISQKTMFR